jgi:hypothetical protein
MQKSADATVHDDAVIAGGPVLHDWAHHPRYDRHLRAGRDRLKSNKLKFEAQAWNVLEASIGQWRRLT